MGDVIPFRKAPQGSRRARRPDPAEVISLHPPTDVPSVLQFVRLIRGIAAIDILDRLGRKPGRDG